MQVENQEAERIFVGREAEIALFKRCFEAILPENQGKEEYKDCPRILSFWGGSGVGKTRLVKRLLAEAKITTPSVKIKFLSLIEEGFISNIFDPFKYDEYVFNHINQSDEKEVRFDSASDDDRAFNNLAKDLKKESKSIPIILCFDNCQYYPNQCYFFIKKFLKKLIIPQSNILIILSGRFQLEMPLAELLENNNYFKEIELKYDKEIIEQEKEEISDNVIATMTHNLNQNFGAILNDFKTLKALIKIKESGQEMPMTFDEVLIPLEKNLLDATQTFNTTQQILRRNHIHPITVNVKEFFEYEILPNYVGKNYEISIVCETDNIVAEIDTNALKDVVRNLIDNAEKHGFETDKNYKIIFEINKIQKYNEEGQLTDFLHIVYKNNGKPFPKGFSFEDYKRLSIKSGKSSGAGIGGYFINKVIDLHKGELRAISIQENSDFPIQLEILLPIEQNKRLKLALNGIFTHR
ncbi:MAG: hypothetical protein MUE81_19855 [Thermoflexibacter sp.]|jgi:nitrogen-specific signal transduction histidine kinase|nr:hypothetical protein [Thermoflexibacter sp.]